MKKQNGWGGIIHRHIHTHCGCFHVSWMRKMIAQSRRGVTRDTARMNTKGTHLGQPPFAANGRFKVVSNYY